MAACLTAAFLFLLFIVQAAREQRIPSSEAVGAVGGVAYLSPRLQKHMPYNQIHWRCNNTVRIATWSKESNNTSEERMALFPNGTLKISDLQKNDSNVYQVYQEGSKGQEDIENIFLTVYELVPKPTVNAKVIREDTEHCKATLECSVELEGVTYEWIPPTKLPLEGVRSSKQHVSFSPLMETYICRVSNPVSSNNASLTYKHPCSWTGESSVASSRRAVSVLLALGHLLFLLTLA
ncbi:CD48 antigen-like isoform X1 [Phalacrocorax aristotelis]|uniref:CD48 antigen-like isoform X1 n=1 Tax=Phalacrocorax aristotelis TaxID=126867 RepID=UPI003F4B9499